MGVPVIIRDGNDKIYRTEQVGSTKAENDQADENDKRIEERMREIEEELRHITPTIDTNRSSLLELVGQKRGVVELWYRVGERLRPLYDEIEVPNENKKWLYRAFFEHSGELDPSRAGPSVRNLDRPEQSHFCFCCMLAEFPWEFARTTIWTNWAHFFDLKTTKSDSRIIRWLQAKQEEMKIKGGQQDWLRSFAKGITEAFRKKDTGVFTDDQINKRLDEIYNETVNIQTI
jgi:hypothetical protein